MNLVLIILISLMDIILAVLIIRTYHELGNKKSEIGDITSVTKIRQAYQDVLTNDADDTKILLEEYRRAQEMLTHYDNLNWSIGSILVGSNIVSLGFVADGRNPLLLFAAALGGSFSLFAWILWFFRHVAIYNVKNDRLYMIEQKLGMAQHRMVGFAANKGKNRGDKKWLTSVNGYSVALMLFFGLILAWWIMVL